MYRRTRMISRDTVTEGHDLSPIPLVPEGDGATGIRMVTVQPVGIGAAEPGDHNADQHGAGARVHPDFPALERRPGPKDTIRRPVVTRPPFVPAPPRRLQAQRSCICPPSSMMMLPVMNLASSVASQAIGRPMSCSASPKRPSGTRAIISPNFCGSRARNAAS
jgi:hypothetical protein